MPFCQLFWGEGSPTKIDYRRKGALILTSLLEDLVATWLDSRVPFTFHPEGENSDRFLFLFASPSAANSKIIFAPGTEPRDFWVTAIYQTFVLRSGFGTHLRQGSLKDTLCNQLKHGFCHQNKGTPPFARQCSGV